MTGITEDEVRQGLSLSDAGRMEFLVALAVRAANGESDVVVVPMMVSAALAESGLEVLGSWLVYISASKSAAFLPVLERWLANADEALRLKVVAALAEIVNEQTNEVLLRVVQCDDSSIVRKNALQSLVRRGTLGEWTPVDLLAVTRETDWRPITKREYLRLIGRTDQGEDHPGRK